MTSPAAPCALAQGLVWGPGSGGCRVGSAAAQIGSRVCEREQTPAKH
ncbi:hypothetical protein ACDW_00670 [Acidovorax sp. DW039]|nr:hypothetical protein ACDW_00670 [Acidovorax sp. DW039]